MASLARGSILLGNSAADVSALAIGSNGYVLKSDGTDAAWAADSLLTTEQVQDITGAMFSSNTETGIAATYQDADGTIDLVVGTLNQNTTGSAATVTTAAQPNITSLGTLTALTVDNINFNGNTIKSTDSDGDLIFQGNDGGSTITALTLDMSEAGAATFNSTVISPLIDAAIVDGENFKVNGGQGSDGQVLTSTGSGVAWEDGGGGGVTFKTFGTASIMVGDDATGTISAANYNTALGVDVFAALTSGDYNSVLGFQAGYALTTGEENTAVGNLTGQGLTTGSYNTAVGSNSLVNTTTANFNTTLGRSAMHHNTTGAENTAVGSFALHQNTTASHNTAVGYFALEAHTTGSANTGVGRNCMPSLTTGNFNTGLGHGALGNMTTQSSCVAIGINALQTCLTGSGHNTALGADSGTILTTGTHCTFVGSNSGIASGSSNNSVAACIFGADSKAQGSLANGLGYNLTCAAGYTTVGDNANDIRAANGTATWATISDERVKKDITDSTAGLSFINDLRPRTFNFKAKGDLPKEFGGYEEGSTEAYKNDKTNHGFIAQEVKAVIDNHTEITDGFKMWDVRDTGQQEVAEAALIPMLVKAIQELSAEVQKLKGE